jgi:hypothetical protein
MVLKECGQAEYRTMFQAGNLGGIIGSDAAHGVAKGGPFDGAAASGNGSPDPGWTEVWFF